MTTRRSPTKRCVFAHALVSLPLIMHPLPFQYHIPSNSLSPTVALASRYRTEMAITNDSSFPASSNRFASTLRPSAIFDVVL